MERGGRVRKFGRKLTVLFAAALALFAISIVTTTMLATTTVTVTDAGQLIGSLDGKTGSNALWALIIPAAFFLVLSSRGWKHGR